MRAVLALGILIAVLIFGGVIWFSRLLAVGTIVLVLVCVVAVYHLFAPPGCDADDVTFAVTARLASQFPDSALAIQRVQTLHGGLFSTHKECEMQVRPTMGAGSASDAAWTSVAYTVFRPKMGEDAEVVAHVLGPAAADN